MNRGDERAGAGHVMKNFSRSRVTRNFAALKVCAAVAPMAKRAGPSPQTVCVPILHNGQPRPRRAALSQGRERPPLGEEGLCRHGVGRDRAHGGKDRRHGQWCAGSFPAQGWACPAGPLDGGPDRRTRDGAGVSADTTPGRSIQCTDSPKIARHRPGVPRATGCFSALLGGGNRDGRSPASLVRGDHQDDCVGRLLLRISCRPRRAKHGFPRRQGAWRTNI